MEKKMSKSQIESWTIGQYQMATALIEAIERGHDLDATLNECLKQIGETGRNNGQIHLLFATVELRQRLAQTVKVGA